MSENTEALQKQKRPAQAECGQSAEYQGKKKNMSKADEMYKAQEAEMQQSVSTLTAQPPKKKEHLFRRYKGCPKAEVLDKIGMCIMLACFAAIVVATVLAMMHSSASGPILFFATYIGIIGYLITSHASNVYIRYVKQKLALRQGH